MSVMSTQAVGFVGTLTNPSQGTTNPRRFKVSDVWVTVRQPNGVVVDVGRTGAIFVEVAGTPYVSSKQPYPQAGSHQFQPRMKLLSNEQIDGEVGTLDVVTAAVSRELRDDGSIWDVTTFSDGRTPVQTMVEGPLRPTFRSGSIS